MNTHSFKRQLFAFLGAVTVWGAGCTSPDVDARFEDFANQTKGLRGGTQVSQNVSGGQYPFSGHYLFALKTSLSDKPFLFTLEATVASGNDSFDLSFQALDYKTLSPVGSVNTANNIAVASNGDFSVDLGVLHFPGVANPASGGDITATVQLQGKVTSDSSFCGSATGSVTSPITAELSGTTFGVVKVGAAQNLSNVTPVTQCAAGSGGPAGPVDKTYYHCPEGDHSGTYLFEFSPSFAGKRTEGKLTLQKATSDSESKVCYTGLLTSSDGSVTYGSVKSYGEVEGRLLLNMDHLTFPKDTIEGVNEEVTAGWKGIAVAYKEEGACGSFESRFTSSAHGDSLMTGTWSLWKEGTTNVDRDASEKISGCNALKTQEDCTKFNKMFDQFGTGSFLSYTAGTLTPAPVNLQLKLEKNSFTCVTGTITASADSSFVGGWVTSTKASPQALHVTGFKTKVAEGADPSWGTQTFTVENGNDTMFCGQSLTNVQSPTQAEYSGTFAVGRYKAPSEPKCP